MVYNEKESGKENMEGDGGRFLNAQNPYYSSVQCSYEQKFVRCKTRVGIGFCQQQFTEYNGLYDDVQGL